MGMTAPFLATSMASSAASVSATAVRLVLFERNYMVLKESSAR